MMVAGLHGLVLGVLLFTTRPGGILQNKVVVEADRQLAEGVLLQRRNAAVNDRNGYALFGQASRSGEEAGVLGQIDEISR